MFRPIIVAVAIALLTACGTDDSAESSPASAPVVAETTTTTAAQTVGEDAEEVSGRPLTPTPSEAEALLLEDVVAQLYPGVPEGKAVDWARSTCADMLTGDFTEDEIVARTQQRFAGGDRPDPTAEQAAQIILFIEAGEWCVAE